MISDNVFILFDTEFTAWEGSQKETGIYVGNIRN